MQKLQRNKAGEYRPRRRFGGKTVLPGSGPRSHQSYRSPATTTYTCGDTAIRPVETNSRKLGPYRVPAPTKREHRRGVYGNIG